MVHYWLLPCTPISYNYILIGYFFNLCIRYSSDDTDDDTNTGAIKKKKSASNLRRQTLANPMPPPSPISSDIVNTTKNLVKENLSPPHLEFKDPPAIGTTASSFECSPATSTTRTTLKTVQNRFVRTQKSSTMSDGLDTGSDSDVTEDTASTFAGRSKYLSNINRLYDSHRIHDRGLSYELDNMSKSKPVHMTTKDTKYSVNPMKSNVTTMQSSKDDTIARDSGNQRDILANYETPFLSEFTRRLSSRSLINTSPTPLSSLKSKCTCVWYNDSRAALFICQLSCKQFFPFSIKWRRCLMFRFKYWSVATFSCKEQTFNIFI